MTLWRLAFFPSNQFLQLFVKNLWEKALFLLLLKTVASGTVHYHLTANNIVMIEVPHLYFVSC